MRCPDDLVGKTIARVAVEDYGETLYFTNGTAAYVSSDDGHYWESFARGVRQRERQGKREAARLNRLKRDEWNALTQAVRDERTRVRRSKMSPSELAFEDLMGSAMRDMVKNYNRAAR